MTRDDSEKPGGEVWAIIPARGGSRGIPHKNLQEVDGVPLVARAVMAGRDARRVDRVIVSTDDRAIEEAARSAGGEVVRRPDDLAGDLASSESALLHVLETLAGQGVSEPAVTVMIQCTSPFIVGADIDATLGQLDIDDADCAMTVASTHQFVWQDSERGAAPVGHELRRRAMRQELEPRFAETGAVYAMRTSGLVETGRRFFGRIALHAIDPWRAIQIDEPADLDAARALSTLFPRPFETALPDPVSGLVLDFDGVLTDDRVITDQNGVESVVAHRGDGLGIELLRAAGIRVYVLSKETNAVVAARCRKLDIPFEQAVDDKLSAFSALVDREGLDVGEVVFVGNDVNDVECIQAAGCGVAVADASAGARAAADIVLTRPGGRGAVRELSELILESLDQD